MYVKITFTLFICYFCEFLIYVASNIALEIRAFICCMHYEFCDHSHCDSICGSSSTIYSSIVAKNHIIIKKLHTTTQTMS